MTCPSCGSENPTTNRFCGGCGGSLARGCPACAHVNPPDHRFCGACGASLVAPLDRVAKPGHKAGGTGNVVARKIVTVVFADVLEDHRPPGLLPRSRDEYLASIHALLDLRRRAAHITSSGWTTVGRSPSSSGSGTGALRGTAREGIRSDLVDRNVPRDPEEAGGREVTVEREGMADALRAHDGEARRVDEAEVLVGV